MRTRVTNRGQVSIPAAIRRKLRITANTALEWIVEGNAVRVIPIPDEPIAALRGSGKRGAVRRLVDGRRGERRRNVKGGAVPPAAHGRASVAQRPGRRGPGGG